MAEYSGQRSGAPAPGAVTRLVNRLSAPDPAYARLRGRVVRLAAVSVVALGVIFALGVEADEGALATVALATGWVLMPCVLLLSLRVPGLKFGLAIPASLVSLATGWLALRTFPAPGWPLLSAGILMGAVMGAWFWFRWAPIPAPLLDHNGPARITLLAVHVALVVLGIGIVALD